MMLLMILLTTTTAWANDAVTYIDMNGKTQTVTEYTEVTSSMTADGSGDIVWSSGTYVVKSDVTLNGRVGYSYTNINLIVCDGATLTVNGNSYGAFSSNTFNIYAQSNGTGVVKAKKKIQCNQLNIAGGTVTLDADGDSNALCIYYEGNGLTVNGGDVTIQNNSGEGTINLNIAGSVTLNGGKLTVTNSTENSKGAFDGNGDNTVNFNGGTAEINGDIFSCRNINLNGGNVTVNGSIISADGYTVTYYFASTTDSYEVKSFSTHLASWATRTVQVADGITFLCNGNSYSGMLSDEDITAISGETMAPVAALQLDDDADNTDVIAKCNGATGLSVTLRDRTLYKDGYWNTLCLPFDVDDFSGTPLAGATVKELDVTGTYDTDKHTGLDGTTLYLYFKNATSITAGKPYIVKWASGENITDPEFTGVTIDKTNRDVAFTGGSFKGTYKKTVYETEDQSILFLGEKNQLHWPDANASLGAFRAYFDLAGAPAREFKLNFDGEGTQTGISHTEITDITEKADAWYTVNGVKLSGVPTTKGLYIHGGRKVIVK